ncbi:PAS domain S-box protein [Pedobacter heparinus]|uniref:histidine kinase n=1 Tax=Pedobacter heparinus (strain ATCC 13125 / DSM 2366 / CIP 104194 / JCM 7457 / NBRC 12017 / NCIMB 9290 / NRRL B-14731 / HIM 762-3) TaxID=485917 RepID=C6XVF3_PEDHD|nr:PAS domain S-box protein [Pedobacter heparinus]ACU04019.1 PAS sensor protein [Pedobacter heparinus DSM 2366]
MSDPINVLSAEQLNYILSFSPTATAIHVGEQAQIQFANDAMLAIWGRGKEVLGKTLVQAMPELEGQPFVEMFARVWHEGITLSGSDTPAEILTNGELNTFYFDFEYRAIKNEVGSVIGILHTATDVTERYLNRRDLAMAIQNKELLEREQTLNEELAASNEELSAINEELLTSREELARMNAELESMVQERVKAFAESEERFRSMADNTDVLVAVADESGRRFYFNKAWSKLTGRTADKLMVSGWHDLIHELDRQRFQDVHGAAFAKRASYSDEIRVLGQDGSYHWLVKKGTPRFLSDGTFAGYISSCIDITQRKLDEQKLQSLNEKLAASNEEFAALNEELATTNEELAASYDELVLSEARFRNLIKQAPVAICVIRANDLMITEVNTGYLELVGKQLAQLENHTIWDAVAEAAEVYAPLMQQVISTGIPFHAREHELILVRNGIDETVFVDFVYEPVTDLQGQVTSIMVVGNEVTDKVLARRRIEDAEERSRLAIEAAEIGTYEFSYIDGSLTSSERFNEIFGLQEPVSRERVLATYHPLDEGVSEQAHAIAKQTGRLFYETRLLLTGGALKWIRVQGNVHYSSEGVLKKLLGTVIDITEFKRLQQQKDDFISIASHELKTPITSLKASLQLLERMKANPTPMLSRLIEQSNRSMEKVSVLVDDLLNVTRINEGQMALVKKKFSFNKMIDECCSQVRQLGTHELVVQGVKELQIVADENRIEQVISNFVTNAVKYATASREIFLKIEDLDQQVKISVRDTGPGIPANKLPHLFDRYFRADQTGAQVSGLGLGLYICADIIKRHGGEIGVDSIEGVGSTFWFTIPIGG